MSRLPALKGQWLCFVLLFPFFLSAQDNSSSSVSSLSFSSEESERDTGFAKGVYALVESGSINGPVAQHNNDKTIYYEAHIKNKKLHGNWHSWYAGQKKRDSGHFQKGIPDGEWKTWNEEGELTTVRHFSADLYLRLKQEVVRYHPRHNRFALSKYHYEENSLYKAALDPAAHFRLLNTGYLPVYKTGLLHGLYMNYYANGQMPDSGYYRYGLREGVWHLAGENGQYWTGAYLLGKKDKEWKLYNASGKLLRIEYYHSGRKEREKIYK